jgi:N utilization substance protein B
MSRRTARELALRALFAVDCGKVAAVDALAKASETLPRARQDPDGFGTALVEGTLANLASLDAALLPHLRGWTMAQMPAVDRTLLRIAAFELLHTGEPAAAVISEAVVLAKQYSTAESGRFINGVLGSLVKADAPSV